MQKIRYFRFTKVSDAPGLFILKTRFDKEIERYILVFKHTL